MRTGTLLTLIAASLWAASLTSAQNPGGLLDAVSGLKLRGIGPAMMGGRIADIAINPEDRSTWYIAVGSGGVWKSVNAGITWKPIFDDKPSYSIGCVTLDPSNPDVVWVGTGENVSGRHVGHGDGIYRSRDGGVTFEHLGLAKSEHIGRIVVDPRTGNTVYVAAEGPLWSSGGERGLYKTTDGGTTWKCVLEIDANTGVTDVQMDPRDPNVLYAASYQRRRHIWSHLGGGKGSGIHKSVDGGRTWRRITRGLPKGDMGKIGLAVSPADPDVVYATIEADRTERGFYRSRDRGETWEKRDSYISGGTGPHYYQEIVASPHDVDVVYQMDVFLHVTRNGGKDFAIVGDGRQKHSDNHALVIDPRDPEHLVIGSDASVYESFDDGATWRQVSNLPVSQFYKVAVDDSVPFTKILGGAQDLGTLMGPLRTPNTDGVRNRDWFVPLGADGYAVAFEPGNERVAYMEIQGGELYRYDRVTHELTDIKPQPGEGDPPQRWNWDAPLVISPHDPKRLYFGSQRVWRSDDRGHSWRAVSGDLTGDTNRYEMKFYGRTWSIDALHDTRAMSLYGTTTTLSESPKVEGLLYAGTDDGRIQVSEDGGANWRVAAKPPGDFTDLAFINDVQASLHDGDTVFAAIDAHKVGDYRPWLFASTDRGRTWTSIAGDLPTGAYVWAILQDHVVPDLLFAGTEKGLYFTPDRGKRWVKLSGGVPMISFRDLAIQRRDDDLVGATFGRGFYVLDDYAPLRAISRDPTSTKSTLFGVRDAWWYVPHEPMQAKGGPSLGSTSYAAENPPFGAVFTWYLAEDAKTAAERRRAQEKKLRESGADAPIPTWERLAEEAREAKPFLLFTIRDGEGNAVRRLRAPAKKGIHRTSWDLRRNAPNPVRLQKPAFQPPWSGDPTGPLVAPGTYAVEMALVTAAGVERIGSSQRFEVRPVPLEGPTPDYAAIAAFQFETSELLRHALGADKELASVSEWLRHVRPALVAAPAAEATMFTRLAQIETRLAGLVRRLRGDPIRGRRNEAADPSILGRVRRVASRHWQTRQDPTKTQREGVANARTALTDLVKELRELIDVDLAAFEASLEGAGATWTPRRKTR